jgi:hypothetical protein
VDQDSVVIQKALVIAHQYYTTNEKYEDALNITNLLAEKLDKEGSFVFAAKNIIPDTCSPQYNLMQGTYLYLKRLWEYFTPSRRYNLENY